MRSHRPIALLVPLLRKEIRELATGNSLWVLLLLLSPLVGYSFIQAVALYAEASRPALSIPELARQLSPFDGVLVPTLGGFYLAITLLFPFIAIRLLAAEKASGGLKLLVQLPYRLTDLVTAKFAALTAAWLVTLIPVLSALIYWKLLGGHLDTSETVILIVGHLLYALLIGAISFLAAALTEAGATAAILALAVTLGSWVLDFAALDRGSVSSALASLSLTSLLRPFEQGLLSIPNVLAMLIVTAGFLALTAIWLPPGTSLGRKLSGSSLIIGAAGILIGGAAQVAIVLDVTSDRRNSFPPADEQLLGRLGERLFVTVHMAPSDPRVVDLDRKVLARLKRAMRRVTVQIADSGQASPLGTVGEADYGEIVMTYRGRSATTRSTGAGEILPMLYALAGATRRRPAPPVRTSPAIRLSRMPRIPRSGSTASSHLPLRRRGGLPPETGEYDGADPDEKEMDHDDSCSWCNCHGRYHWCRMALAHAGWCPDRLGYLLAGFEIPTVQLAQAQPARAPEGSTQFDFSNETVGAEPKSFLSVVGFWTIGAEGDNKFLVVDGRRWKQGQPAANVADKARAIYGERYAEFLDNVQAYAYFPYAVAQGIDDFRSGEISFRFKPVAGRIDQGAGILFNLKPNGDYLLVRANALENNLVLFKYEKGKRSSVEWIRNTPTPSGQWQDLKVRIDGAKVEGYLNGKLYLEHTLPAPVSGKIGVWSKADSVVYFDDYRVVPAPQG